MKFTPVLVTWHDAVSVDEWTAISDVEGEPALCHSVGFLIKYDSDKLTLALNHDAQNDNLSCIMTIPFGMVRSITPLAASNKKGKFYAKSSKYRVPRSRDSKRG